MNTNQIYFLKAWRIWCMEIAILDIEAENSQTQGPVSFRRSGHLPMQPIAVGLQTIVVKSLRQASTEEAPLLAWPLACGNSVSKRTRAIDFADGVLRVEVPDIGWRTELQAIASQYLAILNRYVSANVKRIDFVIANDGIAINRITGKIQR